jgi:hypothetical protein
MAKPRSSFKISKELRSGREPDLCAPAGLHTVIRKRQTVSIQTGMAGLEAEGTSVMDCVHLFVINVIRGRPMI